MTSRVIPVVLSGGSGTRLWPLSRRAQPKQFLSLLGESTLFQQTLLRLSDWVGGMEAPIVVCNESHRFLVAEQLREIGIRPRAIVLEPVGRNTAPAVAVAALLSESGQTSADNLLVLPADHVIRDSKAFETAAICAARAAATERLVTFGVVPRGPETGYGYLRRGEDHGEWFDLAEFVEKPDLATAERYVTSGHYLWNSGMFMFRPGEFLAELERHAQDIHAQCLTAVAQAQPDADFIRLGRAFEECRSDSIDYAVMEKTERAAVVPLDAGWSDVGSWSALHEVSERDQNGNVALGRVIEKGCQDSYLRASSRLVAAVGLRDIVVVETPDAVLVMARDRAQGVKAVVEQLDDESS